MGKKSDKTFLRTVSIKRTVQKKGDLRFTISECNAPELLLILFYGFQKEKEIVSYNEHLNCK